MLHEFVGRYCTLIKVTSKLVQFTCTCCHQPKHPGLSCSRSKQAFILSIQPKHQVRIIKDFQAARSVRSTRLGGRPASPSDQSSLLLSSLHCLAQRLQQGYPSLTTETGKGSSFFHFLEECTNAGIIHSMDRMFL